MRCEQVGKLVLLTGGVTPTQAMRVQCAATDACVAATESIENQEPASSPAVPCSSAAAAEAVSSSCSVPHSHTHVSAAAAVAADTVETQQSDGSVENTEQETQNEAEEVTGEIGTTEDSQELEAHKEQELNEHEETPRQKPARSSARKRTLKRSRSRPRARRSKAQVERESSPEPEQSSHETDETSDEEGNDVAADESNESRPKRSRTGATPSRKRYALRSYHTRSQA